jgi:glycosyltransferase involved in cell wall biosynthesis
MCVYNGARYLPAQLESIARQAERPLCMAIVDDGSTDGSWELLQAWAAGAPFRVLLHRNQDKLGVTRNFEKAARLLVDEVDVIFFSDQDDEWFAHKASAFVDAFAADPGVGLVHSDADLVDGDGHPLGRRLLDALLVTPRERAQVAAGKAYLAYAKRNLVTGAACACRSEVLRRALPFSGRWVHDAWIAFTAALVSRVGLIEQPAMAYRLHSGNTIGLPVPDLRWRARTVLQSLLTPQVPHQLGRMERLQEMHAHAAALGAPAEALQALELALRHARHRSTLSRQFFRRAGAVLAEWRAGQYRAWSSGRSSMLHDLFLAS